MIVKQQLSCAGGEISPRLDSRFDLDKYQFSCLRLSNFIALPQGTAQKRPGTEFVDVATSGGDRLAPFQVSTDETLFILFGASNLQVRDEAGIIEDVDENDVTFPTPWNGAELSQVRWKQINNLMYWVHPDHPPYRLARFEDNSWDFSEVDYGTTPALLNPNLGDERQITVEVLGSASPWASATSYAVGDLVSYDSKDWSCNSAHTSGAGDEPGTGTYDEVRTFWNGYYWQQETVTLPLWTQITYEGRANVGQEITLTSNADLWQAGHVGSTWEIAEQRTSGDYERKVSLLNIGTTTSDAVYTVTGWTIESFGTWDGAITLERSVDDGATWTALRTWTADGDRNISSEGVVTGPSLLRLSYTGDAAGSSNPYAVLTVTDALIRGLAKITAFTSANEVTATVVQPVEVTTTSNWSEGAWSDVQGYPRTIELHQGRVVMAATEKQPHTVWGSAVDDYENFLNGVDADQSWRHTIAVGERDPILWLLSERNLLIGTGSSEWMLYGEDDQKAITPSAGNARRQTTYGSHTEGPAAVFADSTALFVQTGGRAVREFLYSFQEDRYLAGNLNLLSDDMLQGTVTEMSLMRSPWQVLWVVSNGKLYGLTYERGQGVVAWHRHDVGAFVYSVTVLRTNTEEDAVYLTVLRDPDPPFPQVTIERFYPGLLRTPADNGRYMDSSTPLAPPYTDSTRLTGKDCIGWANGTALVQTTITSGAFPFVTDLAITPSFRAASSMQIQGIRNGKPWFAVFDGDNSGTMIWENDRWLFSQGATLTPLIYTTDDTAYPEETSTWRSVATDSTTPQFQAIFAVPPVVRKSIIVDYGAAQFEVPFKEFDSNGYCDYRLEDGDVTLRVEGRLEFGDPVTGWRRWTIYYTDATESVEHQTGDFDLDVRFSPAQVTTWELDSGSLPAGWSTPTVEYTEEPTDLIMGYPYDAEFQPMTPEMALANGTSRSREMRIHKVALSLLDSRGGKIGPELDGELDAIPWTTEDATTGDVETELSGDHDKRANVAVVSDEPFPFNLRSLILKLKVKGDA